MEELKKKVYKGLYECNDTNGACACCPYRNTGCEEALLFDTYILLIKEPLEVCPD